MTSLSRPLTLAKASAEPPINAMQISQIVADVWVMISGVVSLTGVSKKKANEMISTMMTWMLKTSSPFLTKRKWERPKPKPIPLIPFKSGEINIAPIIEVVEL